MNILRNISRNIMFIYNGQKIENNLIEGITTDRSNENPRKKTFRALGGFLCFHSKTINYYETI